MKTLTLLVAFTAVVAGCGDDRARGASRAGAVWYHASDVALVGSTGRPQLLEFFHPT